MNKIKILAYQEAIKIAAGEVIEQPSNIIKELLENSIDAQAKNIMIFLLDGGKKQLRVVDDGFGMSFEDAKSCFIQHATSKISCLDDIYSINSFGFRGEALASIAAVGQLIISSKISESELGVKLLIEDLKIKEESFIYREVGTTIELNNLFDKFPVRKKFLKKDSVELNSIIKIFQAFCLAYKDINFKLYNNEILLFNVLKSIDLKNRAAQLFNLNLVEHLFELNFYEDKAIKISGLLSNTSYSRYGTDQIFIFVNNRLVKNSELLKSLLKGYAAVLPFKKYPAAIIFITVDNSEVDINVHPKKIEVKFLNPLVVQNALTKSIKNSLDSYYKNNFIAQRNSQVINLKSDEKYEFVNDFQELHENNNENNLENNLENKLNLNSQKNDFLNIRSLLTENESSLKDFEINKISFVDKKNFSENTAIAVKDNENIKKDIIKSHQNLIIKQEYRLIGQFDYTYIVLEKLDALVLVDQHAAHERIIFQQLSNSKVKAEAIKLIFPEFIKLSIESIAILMPYISLLRENGILLSFFSNTQLKLEATPFALNAIKIKLLLEELVEFIVEENKFNSAIDIAVLNSNIYSNIACKKAYKAGDVLNFDQLNKLLEALLEVDNKYYCPHGRPIFFSWPKQLIKQNFKRDYKKKTEVI